MERGEEIILRGKAALSRKVRKDRGRAEGEGEAVESKGKTAGKIKGKGGKRKEQITVHYRLNGERYWETEQLYQTIGLKSKEIT